MQRNKLSLIMLVAASLLMCLVLAGGVLYAWLLSNREINAGIRVSVTDLEDSGVEITSFNDGRVPDDGFGFFPGDKMKLGLRTLSAVTDFKIGFTNNKLSDSEFDYYFTKYIGQPHRPDRTDILYGVYRQESNILEQLDGGDGSPVYGKIEYDYDLDLAMEGYLAQKTEEQYPAPTDGSEFTDEELKEIAEYRNELKKDVRLKFLKKFTDQNNLINALTVKLLAVRPWDGRDGWDDPIPVTGVSDYFIGDDFDNEFMLTPPSYLTTVRPNMFSLPQWVRVYEDEDADPKVETDMYTKLDAGDYNYISIDRSGVAGSGETYDPVNDEIRKTEKGEEYVKIVWGSLPLDTRIDIEVGYGVHPGLGHGIKPGYGDSGSVYRPWAQVNDMTEYGIEARKYYAHSYNCFSFQDLIIGFSTEQG